MTIFGLSDFEDYKLVEHYNDDDISEMMIGHRPISFNGETKEIVVVSIRGTDGTIEEWSSNFDVGANTDEYYEAIGVKPEEMGEYWWDEKSNHKGFDVAANRLYRRLIDYIGENTNKDLPTVVYIVGHSRGAAIANILGTRIEDDTCYEPFVYTFASPATTTDLDKIDDYDFIFNIVNEDDLVTYLPLSKWGFDRYGITYSASIVEDYEDTSNPFSDAKHTWEYMFEIDGSLFDDYNYNNNLYATIIAMEELADCREDLYVYTGDEDRYEYFRFVPEIENEPKLTEALDEYGNRIERYCKIVSEVNTTSTSLCNVQIEQTPAAFMMILADLTASYCHRPGDANYYSYDKSSRINEGIIPVVGKTIGFEVADKYDSAKFWFCMSGVDSTLEKNPLRLGGMEHGHMSGTYYFLANDYNDELEIKSAKKIITEVHRKILENVI